MEIRLYDGPRDLLADLFSEADDSEVHIAGYRDLGELLVAFEADQPVGDALVVETAELGTMELKSLAVSENRRSQGVGAALVAAAMDHCREQGGTTLVVATAAASIPALQFYQRQGFRISRVIRDFYSPGRGYKPLVLNGIPLLDEVILDLQL